MHHKLLFILVCICGYPAFAVAQRLDHDTAFISDHTTDLTVRAFGGYDFSAYKLGQDGGKSLTYKSNDNFDLGAGISYRWVGFNVSLKAPLVNNDDVRFGKTQMLDLRTHLYTRKFTIDLYGLFGKGYYINNNGIIASPPSGAIVLRPDLQTRWLGVNAHYAFNYRRFSYRAAFAQNEYQKKSAGSVIIGAGINHFYIHADSSIIPAGIAESAFFNNSPFNKSQVFCVAVNAGYVQTVVIKDHFFVTGALIGGFGLAFNSIEDEGLQVKNKGTNIQVDGTIRLAAGYNSERYFAGVEYINFLTRAAAPFSGNWQEFESGNFKLTIAKRFPIRRNLIKDVYKTVAP